MKTVLNAARRLLPRKSVSDVVSKIEKNIDDLMAVAQFESDAALDADAAARKLHETARQHRDEAIRAERVASRLMGLVQ